MMIAVNSSGKHLYKKSLGGNVRSSDFRRGGLFWLILSALLCGVPAPAQSQQPPNAVRTENTLPAAQGTGISSPALLTDQRLSGSISGTLVGPGGAFLSGARVGLSREDQSAAQEVLSGDDGQFSFANLAPGPFLLTITAEGFATKTFSGILHPGETCIVPPIELALAANVTEVSVVASRVELAEAEVKEEEKQRALGFIPNFYVTYDPDALPLTSKQKFELAWKTTVDPISFGMVGAVAGIEQAENYFGRYGQGAQGFGKRYGAGFADSVTGTFIGGAILPSLLKQDPRYFYKGTGSIRSRVLYAIANAVICKSDKGRWQANYSGILGSLASGGISNLYYPAQYRGAELVFQNTLVGIGSSAVVNLFEEFLVRKLTPNLPKRVPAKP